MAALFAWLFLKDHWNCVERGAVCSTQQNTHYKIPLPKTVHKVLTERDIGDNHVLVIGDVHGCLIELKELIQKANELTQNRCLFIFVGDLINKGPFSKETLDFVINLGPKAFVVRGNNEDRDLKFYLKLRENPMFLLEIHPKYLWLAFISQVHFNFLRELPYTISIPHLNSTVVHAGLFPWKPICSQGTVDMVLLKALHNSENVSEPVTEYEKGGVPWASLWSGPQHVYFGHDARKNLQLYPYATGLDTGCVYGRQLTAQFLTGSKQFIQVQAAQNYFRAMKEALQNAQNEDLQYL